MNIPHTRADAVVESLLCKLRKHFHARTRSLNRGNIRIQAQDCIKNLAKLRVAQVRVDLRIGTDSSSGQAEGIHCPLEVFTVSSSIQRKKLAQCGFINLNNRDSSVLQISDLVTQGKTNLVSNLSQRQVITREGPRNDGDRTGQHALNRVRSQRLRIACPFNGHRVRTDNVTPQDRRTGTT